MERKISWSGSKYRSVWPCGKMNTVEIEFVKKRDLSYEEEGRIYNQLTGLGVMFKGDCSVRGRNVGRYQEIVISFRDDNYKRLIKVLMVMREHFTVNKSCGLHVHLDARDMSYDEAAENFYRLADMDRQLANLVPSWRTRSQWCRLDSYKSMEEEDRYRAVNWVSYDVRKTVEVRLGAGTLREGIVIPWVRLLNYIWDNESVSNLSDIKDPFLVSWIRKRLNQFKHQNQQVQLFA